VSTKEKIKNFVDEKGVRKQWIADKLGMPRQQFYSVSSGFTPCPKKYWVKLMQITEGHVSMEDLMEDFLKEFDFIEVRHYKNPRECIVSLKEINN
jgi:hypothetical protein